jgi:DNA-binding response OmpR family regulator/predicted regulator of Ras-like GTPase activity (Roadblock/LC7/MglB family)
MKKQSILVVDDELIFVRSVMTHLQRKNQQYEIKTAYNGREALNFLEEGTIDLVILDINMPVVDGIQFLTELHNNKIWLPIIILSGVELMTTEQEVKIFREYGIVEYMNKPVDFDVLEKKVEEVLNHFEIVKKPSSGIGIPTILRVIESEKRTGVLTVVFDDGPTRMFFRDGDVIDVDSKGLSAIEAFKRCLEPESEKSKINIEYINHKRAKKITLSFHEVLLEKEWLVKKSLIPGKSAAPAKIFENLNSIPGFIGAAVYRWNGQVIHSSGSQKLNLLRMGRLGLDLFDSANDITRKMNWGESDFVEIGTKETNFVFTCIAPDQIGLGVAMKTRVNTGRIKLEISKVVEKLKKVYALPPGKSNTAVPG